MVSIMINSFKFSDEQKKSLNEFLNSQISELEKTLKLSTLKRIIITEKFTEDVIKVQKEYCMRELGHTDNENGIAIAKVLHTEDNEKFRQTIVINDYILLGLFNPKMAQSSFHFLHHELCHVHDNYYTHTIIYTQEARKGKNLNKLQHVLICNADPVWSEYIAVRLSAQSVQLDSSLDDLTSDLYLSYLLNLIESCESNLNIAISQYRFHSDIDHLFKYLQEETSLLFKISATTLGYLDGLNLNNSDVRNIIDEKIKETYFYDTWKRQGEILNNLFNLYPNWNDVYELIELGNSINDCWHNLGIKPKYLLNENYIYIDVP